MQATTLKRVLLHPRQLMDALLARSARWIKDDKLFLSLRWWCRMGYWLDWEHPRTFCEKLQWLKLYNRNPLYIRLVDKQEAKKYVADIVGEEYIIPTLGVWDKPEDIDWEALPNRFVLKCTHDSGGIVICSDKSKLDKKAAIRKLHKCLKRNFFWQTREWPYKDVPKRIIAEQFMAEKSVCDSLSCTDLADYKFYCFNGEPTYCQVIRDRSTKETIDFYDMEWNHMPFCGLNPVVKNGLNPVARPVHLEKLIEIARQLSCGIPFVRIDLYVINDREYFGEITFYPASGFGTFHPSEWDERIGDMIQLPMQ